MRTSKRRRRGKKASNENHERWLVSYADFITLLFAFFTSLYAISIIDSDKGLRLVRSIHDSFGARPFLMGNETPGLFETFRGHPIELGNDPGGIDEPPSGHVGFDLLERRLHDLGKNAEDGQAFSVKSNEEGLVISLADSLFFQSGGAKLAGESTPVLQQVAELLRDVDNHIRVEGHTDNQQISSARFPSNWHLSATRAVEVVQALERAGVPPLHLSASGFADQRPLYPNGTAEGRRANRRVDIVVLRARTPQGDL